MQSTWVKSAYNFIAIATWNDFKLYVIFFKSLKIACQKCRLFITRKKNHMSSIDSETIFNTFSFPQQNVTDY